MRPFVCLTLILFLPAGLRASADDLLGTRPAVWEVSGWINSEPLELDALAGNVVLVRWWTGPHCPLCRASAAALNEFHERFRERGLVVIGLYHHKSRSPLHVERVARYAESLGFEFPLAIDRDWRTLRAWWLEGHERGFTSVSFLIGRSGRIRYIHPGGKYVRGDGQFERLERAIELLLGEHPGSGP